MLHFQFLQYYPAEVGELPYNGFTPEEMPDHAWFNFWAMRQYPDLTNEEMGIPNLGDPNVTFPDWKVMEERRAYYASLSYADQQLGRVLNELEDLGLAESTIVVFWGDHGYQLGEHTEWMKTTNFEIANWVPLMLRVPGSTKEGSSTDELVEMVDLFPTLVDAAGLPPLNLCSEKDSTRTRLCTEGASMMPLVEESGEWRDAAFWQYRGKGGGYGGNPTVIPTTMGYTVRFNIRKGITTNSNSNSNSRTRRYSYTEWVYIEVLDEEVGPRQSSSFSFF